MRISWCMRTVNVVDPGAAQDYDSVKPFHLISTSPRSKVILYANVGNVLLQPLSGEEVVVVINACGRGRRKIEKKWKVRRTDAIVLSQ